MGKLEQFIESMKGRLERAAADPDERFIYIDESLHDDHDFMLLSYINCRFDPQEEVQEILDKYATTEYHSSEKMAGNEVMRKIRSELKSYIGFNCKWGVFVLPRKLRHEIDNEFELLIKQLVSLFSTKSLYFFVDEGIVGNAMIVKLREAFPKHEFQIGDSERINGIQLADLTAALSGVQLKEEVSGKPKMLEYGAESGFDPPIKAALGYELWTHLRYAMHKADEPKGEEMPDWATFETEGFGFILSDECGEGLVNSATKVFGEVYLGCIH